MAGITIGHGSVNGMGSVVTKDVAPYAIVAGNPARVIRNRLDKQIIEALLKSEWWGDDDKDLRRMGVLCNDPVVILKQEGLL